MKAKMMGSDEEDSDDEFDDEESEDSKPKPAAKAKVDPKKKVSSAYDEAMKKAGKEVEESSEISMDEDDEPE